MPIDSFAVLFVGLFIKLVLGALFTYVGHRIEVAT